MPRPTSRGVQGFIWIPRTDPTFWKILINGVDVTVDIVPEAEFSKGMCPEAGSFKIELINVDGAYIDRFDFNQTVNFYIDFVDASTVRFTGKIDTIKNVYKEDMGYVLHIEGSHLTRDAYNVLVTESYYGDTIVKDILTALTAKYMPGYTLNTNITYLSMPTFIWENKPFWDVVNDICKVANTDAFIDDDKTIYVFDVGSRTNANEAVVWNDTMVSISGLGKQIVTTKNSVIVIGDDGTGLPVLASDSDASSIAKYGTLPTAVYDSKVSDAASAVAAALGTKNSQATPSDEGEAEALILPSLNSGELIWITNPPDKIHGQYKVYSLTHKLPSERTTLKISRERTLKQILKKRVDNEQASQASVNPYSCTSSINFVFDDTTEISTKDSNVTVTGGVVKLSSGTQGIFTTVSNTAASTISYIHLKAAGSVLTGTTFEVSLDGGSNYQALTLDTLNTLTTTGTNLIMRVTINNINTEIDSIALLLK